MSTVHGRMQLRANRIVASNSVDTTSLLFGVSYHFQDIDAPAQDSFAPAPEALEREVDVLLGRTIVNTFKSEDSFAAQVEYRQRLGRYFAWSVGALHEGDANTQRRSGVIAQFWLGGALLQDRVTAAIGIGPYVILDIMSSLAGQSRKRLDGIFSATIAYAPIPRWDVRCTWSRVFAKHLHDTDVLLLGAGYRF